MAKIEAAVYNWMEAHPTAWNVIDGVVFWGAVAMAVLIVLYLVATELILVWERHREKALPWMMEHGVFDEDKPEEAEER